MISSKTIIKRLAGFSIAPILTAAASFLLIPAISRLFPTEQYGFINLFYTSSTILASVFLLGFDSCYTRFYYESDGAKRRSHTITLGIAIALLLDAVVSLITIVLFHDVITKLLFDDSNIIPLVALSLCTLAQSIFTLLNLRARMAYNYRRYNVQQILQFTALRLSFVFASIFSKHYSYSIYIMTFFMVLLTISYIFIQRREIKTEISVKEKPTQRDVKMYLSYGVPLMISTIVVTINGSIGKFLLNGQGMTSETGIFSIAVSLSFAISFIAASFRNFWSPFMFEHYKDEGKLIKKVHHYVMLIMVMFTVAMFVCQDIIYLLVGRNYKPSQAYFMLLVFSQVAAMICQTTSYGILIKKKSRINLIISLLSLAFNVLFAILLIPTFGGLGAGIGVFVSAVLNLVLTTVIGQHYYDSIGSFYRTIISVFIIMLVCILNCFLFNELMTRLLVSLLVMIVVILIYFKETKEIVVFFLKRNRRIQ